MLRQLYLGQTDMELHHRFDPTGGKTAFDAQKVRQRLMKRIGFSFSRNERRSHDFKGTDSLFCIGSLVAFDLHVLFCLPGSINICLCFVLARRKPAHCIFQDLRLEM